MTALTTMTSMTTVTSRTAEIDTVTEANGVAGGDLRPLRTVCRRRVNWLRVRIANQQGSRSDAGMATAEYAIGTVAACAFAAILYKVVTSGTVSGAVAELLDRALHAV
ncbi:DUF4244 domain-containing protein [Kitasatospora sp. McL0602]|uniref:DUF4244 domain-containing protein n=1 Tax=Kitasatospora sp. McL0602 TaxID=3439530 RepID=UPI003F88C1E8